MLIPDFFSNLTRAAYHVAIDAGNLLREGYHTDFEVLPKKLKNDVVTEYDFAAERMIIAHLSKEFPSHSFLCEESGESRKIQQDSIRWVIDPLDGTVNFAHHIPLFCVSIAACKGEEILCGVIYAPITGEMFIAERQIGAYLNNKPLKVSTQNKLSSSYLATSLSFNLHENPDESIDLFCKMAHLGFPVRAFGSTALNLGYIAAGKLDGYWSTSGSLSPWDVAAGKLLIEEAGGKVTQRSGREFSLDRDTTLLASNGLLHEELVRLLNP
jgi:myo-inositol-1(or 4)-monophosphatase